MNKEIHTTPIILIMTLFLALIIFLLESAAFVAFKAPAEDDAKHKKEFSMQSDQLTNHILNLVQPDSIQTKQIRSLADLTSDRIRKAYHSSRKERRMILDSLRLQLKPILTDDQFKRLESMTLFPNRVAE